MTDIAITRLPRRPREPAGTRALLDRLFAHMGQGFNAYLERVGRYDRIRKLQAKSDAELARMGLTRDRIPYHVFSDLFYL